ncbi:MAG: hypothetical protein GX256_02270, partial [Fretibacterium sp.]|nr:hypothetical protein [Fretibacterium sp.]
MRKMVKSLFMALLLLAFLVPAAPALADAALDVIVYECLACDKTFYSFMGCDLTNKEYKNEGPQLSNVFRLGPGWRNLEPCKGFKYHIFDKKNTGKVRMSDIAKYLSMFAVEKGRTINGSHTRWKCFMCDKVIYTLNDDDPNI